MEMSFYDDSRSALKRPATLNLESSTSKKQKLTAILTSPDLNMLKLASPELERLIIANAFPTPTTTQILYPKSVTEEQENYARGFIDALNSLHQTSIDVFRNNNNNPDSNPPNSTGAPTLFPGVMPIYLASPSVIKSASSFKSSNVLPPSISAISDSSNSQSEVSIKQEDDNSQTVPDVMSSPPMSPVNMEVQERIKLERKRQRNRVAASKCRRKKLEKISHLEEKVQELKDQNSKLESFADKLRQQVCNLKQTVLEHVKKGCQIMVHQQPF